MRILQDTVRPDLLRIKGELEALRSMSVHIGILGDAGSDLLMIARVHEYGATIHAKNVKHLAIPVRDRDHAQKPPDREYRPDAHKPRKQRTGGKKDPRPDNDYEWMYMLVDSVTVPERSFIRASYDTGRRQLEGICKEAVDGIVCGGWTARDAMEYIGKWALEVTRDYFNTKLSPPKSATTQLTTTQYQPLFDTGRLFRSITYRVEGGGSE